MGIWDIGKGGGWNLTGIGLGLVGDYLSGEKQAEQLQRQTDLQREFAQQGIQWRVKDAREAGINPLAALGFSGTGFNSVGIPSDNLGTSLSNMGQNISRSVGATMSLKDRLFQDKVNELTLERMGLQNKILGQQYTNISRTVNPPMPDGFGDLGIKGQSTSQDPGKMDIIPTGRTAHATGNPSQAFGSITDWYFRATPTGLKVAPSPDVQGVLANNAVEMLKWEASHKANELFNPQLYRPNKKEFPLPPGQTWEWNWVAQEWQPFSESYSPFSKLMFKRKIRFRK